MKTALIGKLPWCGHYVAIDADPTPERRADLESRGYVVEEKPWDEACSLIGGPEASEHEATCMNVGWLRAAIAEREAEHGRHIRQRCAKSVEVAA